jgi:hypothetical protein
MSSTPKTLCSALLRAVRIYEPAVPPSIQTDDVPHYVPIPERVFRGVKRHGVDVENRSEVERYLADPPADPDEDVLEWWKHHAKDYPRLARIARDYLAIPATSVPVERVFSGGADLVTNKRGSLSEDTIQGCVCASGWLDSCLY